MTKDAPMMANTFERHAQTALVLLLVGLLMWVGNTTQATAVAIGSMRVEIAFLKAAAAAPPPQYVELSKRVDDQVDRLNRLEQSFDEE